VSDKHIQGLPLSRTQKTVRREIEPYRYALWEVLDSLGALGGSWYELSGHGFSEQRAKEICALVEETTV
jgi:hypothetical protein